MTMQKIIANYNAPTPPGLKRLGDFALVMIPTIIIGVPQLPISHNAQDWIVQGSSLFLVALKFWTKTQSSIPVNNDDSSKN